MAASCAQFVILTGCGKSHRCPPSHHLRRIRTRPRLDYILRRNTIASLYIYLATPSLPQFNTLALSITNIHELYPILFHIRSKTQSRSKNGQRQGSRAHHQQQQRRYVFSLYTLPREVFETDNMSKQQWSSPRRGAPTARLPRPPLTRSRQTTKSSSWTTEVRFAQ